MGEGSWGDSLCLCIMFSVFFHRSFSFLFFFFLFFFFFFSFLFFFFLFFFSFLFFSFLFFFFSFLFFLSFPLSLFPSFPLSLSLFLSLSLSLSLSRSLTFSDPFSFSLSPSLPSSFHTGRPTIDSDFSQLYTERGERIAYLDFTGSGLFTQTQIKKVSEMLANRWGGGRGEILMEKGILWSDFFFFFFSFEDCMEIHTLLLLVQELRRF